MNRFLKFYSRLPVSLQVLIPLLAILPGWSLTVIDLSELVTGNASFPEYLAFATFWLLPPALLLTIALRHFLFVFLFSSLCTAVVALSILARHNDPGVIQFGQAVAAVLFLVLSGLIAQKDFLYPFLQSNSKRYWRRNPRLATPQGEGAISAKVIARGTMTYEATVVDVSLSGLALHLAGALPNVDATSPDAGIVVQIGSYCVRGELAWQRAERGGTLVGVEISVRHVMNAIVKEIVSRKNQSYISRVSNTVWYRTAFRRSALALWFMTMMANVGAPACSGPVPDSEQDVSLLSPDGPQPDSSYSEDDGTVIIPLESVTVD